MFNDLAGKSGKLNPEEEVNFCVASATATPLSIAYANESITALGKKVASLASQIKKLESRILSISATPSVANSRSSSVASHASSPSISSRHFSVVGDSEEGSEEGSEESENDILADQLFSQQYYENPNYRKELLEILRKSKNPKDKAVVVPLPQHLGHIPRPIRRSQTPSLRERSNTPLMLPDPEDDDDEEEVAPPRQDTTTSQTSHDALSVELNRLEQSASNQTSAPNAEGTQESSKKKKGKRKRKSKPLNQVLHERNGR